MYLIRRHGYILWHQESFHIHAFKCLSESSSHFILWPGASCLLLGPWDCFIQGWRVILSLFWGQGWNFDCRVTGCSHVWGTCIAAGSGLEGWVILNVLQGVQGVELRYAGAPGRWTVLARAGWLRAGQGAGCWHDHGRWGQAIPAQTLYCLHPSLVPGIPLQKTQIWFRFFTASFCSGLRIVKILSQKKWQFSL